MDFHDAAALQRGHLDLAQARAAGMTQHEVNRLVKQKHWQRPHPGVYRTGSAPPTWEDKVRAACMAAGPRSRAMGRTAARLRGFDGSEKTSLIELAVPKGHGPVPAAVIVRETRRRDPRLTTDLNGIPVSSVNRTLLEYAWLVPVDVMVERAVEHALLRGDTNEGALRRFLAGCGRGVEGVTRLRRILDNRPEGRPARSGFEVIVLDIIREAGLLLPVRRPLLSLAHDRKFELDLAYLDKKIDIEPMGKQWHSTASQRKADAERRRILESLGWIIIDVSWDEAIHRPWEIVARIRQALLSGSATR